MVLTGIDGKKIYANENNILNVFENENEMLGKYSKIIMINNEYFFVKENIKYIVSMIEEGKGRC